VFFSKKFFQLNDFEFFRTFSQVKNFFFQFAFSLIVVIVVVVVVVVVIVLVKV